MSLIKVKPDMLDTNNIIDDGNGNAIFIGNIEGSTLTPTGLTGVTENSRYIGATASGVPTSGTFKVGDFIIDQTGVVWICNVAGTPGTWISNTNNLGGKPASSYATLDTNGQVPADQLGNVSTQLSGVQEDITNLEYNVYNLELTDYYTSKINPVKGMQFDGFSDTTKTDLSNAYISKPIIAGDATLNIVINSGSFMVNETLLLTDGVNYETVVTQVVAFTSVTLVNGTKYSYTYGTLSRTDSIVDVTDKLLKIGTTNQYSVTIS